MQTKVPLENQPKAADKALSSKDENPNLKNQTGYSNHGKKETSVATDKDRAQSVKTED